MPRSSNATVLVTDGAQRASLAVVRSLGAAGCTVHVASPGGRSLAGASRFARSERRTPDPLTHDSEFADALAAVAREIGADVIIPMTEPSLLAVLPRRDAFGDACIPFADAGVFTRIADKQGVLAAGAALGIATPAQYTLETPGDAAALDFDALDYPVVVKPARSVAGSADARIKLSVEHAADAEGLRQVLREMDPRAYPLLVQQRIVGPGIGVFLLLWRGELLAAFAHRRLREKPPSGGVSVYRESVALDPVLLRQSRALLEGFGWEGVAMIEYKIDERTGTPYLMEINGRFWGSLQLAIDAGVDFPRLLLQAAFGEHPEPVTTYRMPVRSRWFWGDIDHVLTMLRHSRTRLALPPGSPGRGTTLRDVLRVRRHDREEIFRWNDPRPFLRESTQWLQAHLQPGG